MKLYLDMCCFGRLFDEQDQPKVKLESEAVLLILRAISGNCYDLISSEVLELENEKNPDRDQSAEISGLLSLSKSRVVIGSKEMARAEELVSKGFRTYDALHVACAESARADYFLSTDYKLVNLQKSNKAELTVRMFNPVEWLREHR